jgi:hypothetical protein
VLPLACLGPIWPWWRFLTLHSERGLQVEALPAAELWLGQHLGWVEAQWVGAPASYEVHGAAASALLGPWKGLWVLLTFGTLALCARVVRAVPAGCPDVLARSVLPVLLAFVAFSPVLSPQYLVWLAGPAALALANRAARAPLLVIAATLLTPLFYPSPTYRTGLDVARTVVLLTRDGLLVAAWWVSLRELMRGKGVTFEQ